MPQAPAQPVAPSHPLVPLLDAVERLQGEMMEALRAGQADLLAPMTDKLRQGLAVLSRYGGQPLPPVVRDRVVRLRVNAQAMGEVLARRQRSVDDALTILGAADANVQALQAGQVYGASGRMRAVGWRSRGFERA